jgi:hypothetical protein
VQDAVSDVSDVGSEQKVSAYGYGCCGWDICVSDVLCCGSCLGEFVMEFYEGWGSRWHIDLGNIRIRNGVHFPA